MSATTALDGLGTVAATRRRSTARRLDEAGPATAPDRQDPAWTSAAGRAARPRAATPVFVDGGRRARWARRLGAAAGLALGLWLASVGLALVGLGSTAGPSVATEGAVLHRAAGAPTPSSVRAAAGREDPAPLFAPAPGPSAAVGTDTPGDDPASDAAAATGSDALLALLGPGAEADGATPPGRTQADAGDEPAAARPAADEGLGPRVP